MVDRTDAEAQLLAKDIVARNVELEKRLGRRTVRLFLFRHGESLKNLNPGVVCGRSNSTPLSEKGKLQAEALGQRLKRNAITWDKVWVHF